MELEMEATSLIDEVRAMMDTVGFQLFLLVLGLSVCVFVYFIPFGIAYSRRHKNTRLIFLLNFMFGWTGLGWIVLLAWSIKGKNKKDRKKKQDRKSREQLKQRLEELLMHERSEV